MDPLEQLNETEIQIGGHQMKFVDTSVAWESFKEIYRDEIIMDDDSNDTTSNDSERKQKKSTALQNFQNILELDGGVESGIIASTLPEHARYNFIMYEKKQPDCDYCHKMTGGCDGRHACRICDRTFHEDCILSRGFCNDALSLASLEESASVLGWSCPNCEGLFSLLTNEEQEEIIELFTQVSGEDGVIDREEFLQLQREEYHTLVGMEMPSFREKQALELFSKIDRDHTGTIDYWEFLPHIAVRFLSRRSSMEILDLLSVKEISNFKEYFRELDTEQKGRLPQSKAKQAYVNWYKSKVKSCDKNYVDFDWYGGLKENHLLQALKESLSSEATETESEEQSCLIEWGNYLKHCTLHILSARANTGEQKPLIPPMPSFLYATGGCSNDDDDFLKLCEEAKKWTNYLEKKGFKL